MMYRSAVKCACLVFVASALMMLAGAARAQTIRDLVYLAWSKDGVGQGTAKLVKQYKCDVPPGSGAFKDMRKVTLPLKIEVRAHTPCDEDGKDALISTTWTILLRVGPGAGFIPFGTHQGSGTYKDSAGNEIKLSFNGTVACGSHRDPFMDCEPCRLHMHFEGWVTGRYFAGPIYSTYIALGLPAPTLKATYTGTFKAERWPEPGAPLVTMPIEIMFEGVNIFNCGG